MSGSRTKKISARGEQFLQEYSEHGFGISMALFCKKFGYGSDAAKRWKLISSKWAERFNQIEASHKTRALAVPGQVVLPRAHIASHAEGLEIWQQNFLESWRRCKRRLEACSKANCNWAMVSKALDECPSFARAYNATKSEMIVGIEDELMVGAYEGKINAVTKLLSTEVEKPHDAEQREHDWWKDTISVSKHYAK